MVRSLEDLAFIRDRVLAEIRANPPRGALLGEEPTKRPDWACKRDHTGAWKWRSGYWYCGACRNAKRAAARRMGRDA